METVGFIGLGLMGTSMTTNLIAAGYDVLGFDVDADRRREHEERGGRCAASPADVARHANIVEISVPHGGIVRDVCLGEDGITTGGAAGLIVMDHSTSHPDDTMSNAAALAEHGMSFLDAPVSGTSRMAAERNLITMVGGDAEVYAQVGEVLDAVTRARYHVGPVGSGVKTKFVINLILGGSRLLLAEALVLGEKAGMDLHQLLEVLKDSVAGNKVMTIYGDRMIAGSHQPPTGRIRSHAKNIELILEWAQAEGAPLKITPILAEVLDTAKASGLAEWDSTATIEVLRREAGLREA